MGGADGGLEGRDFGSKGVWIDVSVGTKICAAEV